MQAAYIGLVSGLILFQRFTRQHGIFYSMVNMKIRQELLDGRS